MFYLGGVQKICLFYCYVNIYLIQFRSSLLYVDVVKAGSKPTHETARLSQSLQVIGRYKIHNISMYWYKLDSS